MKTTGEILKRAIDYLKSKNIDTARRISEELLAHTLGFKRLDLYMNFDRPINDQELNQFRELIRRASQNEPVQYILGEIEFYGCRIKIDRRALIPRPETELLVDMVSKQMKGKVVWDLCTGSGCIAIALKKKHPEIEMIASDISCGALDLARENAALNGVEVQFIQGDFLEPFSGKTADVIVSNPPYVTNNEYEAVLDSSARDFEPKVAFVGGEKGLDFFQKLKDYLDVHPTPRPKVFLELGYSQGESLQKIFPDGEILKDWAGNSRFLVL